MPWTWTTTLACAHLPRRIAKLRSLQFRRSTTYPKRMPLAKRWPEGDIEGEKEKDLYLYNLPDAGLEYDGNLMMEDFQSKAFGGLKGNAFPHISLEPADDKNKEWACISWRPCHGSRSDRSTTRHRLKTQEKNGKQPSGNSLRTYIGIPFKA